MRRLVETFVRYPVYANLIIFFLLIFGIGGALNMKQSFFPERKTTTIIVTVSYPGASPKEMEEGVTTRIEDAIRGIVGIKEVGSVSSEDFASVTITTTGQFDIDNTLTEVKNAIDGISSFPQGAERPIVFKQRATTPAAELGLSGDVDLLTLKKLADQVEYDLLNSGIVSQVAVQGYPELEISIEVSEENLLRYNLTFDDISRAVSQNNRDISGGMIRSTEEEILIRSRSRTTDPNQIANIVIRANSDGSELRIRDLGQVKMQFADVPNQSFLNGKKSISFVISKLTTEDLKEISEYLNDYTNAFNQTHHEIKLRLIEDRKDRLNARLMMLINNGGLGLLLVFIVLGMFLSLRLSLWVAWGIPASFLGMLIVASAYGVTINMISLFGMILVVGILVDDGIVIAENIYSHFEQGKTPTQAAVDGTMEVLPAVTTSVLTTVIAFSPLLLIEGRLEFLFEMAFVVIFSLLFSLLEAFFVLPAHIGTPHVLRHQKRLNFIRSTLDKLLFLMRDKLYAKSLSFILKWRYIALMVPPFAIMVTMGLFRGGLVQATFFPSIPFEQFTVNLAFKPGEGEEKTMSRLLEIEKSIWELEYELSSEYDDSIGFINYTFLNMGNAFDGQETGAHAGNIQVLLKDMEDKPISTFDIVQALKKKVGLVAGAEKFNIGGRRTFGKPISISILGRELRELESARDFMIEKMQEIEALKDVIDNNAIGKREVRIQLKPKAYYLGLTQSDVLNQVRQGFFGGQAQRLQLGKDEVRVWVRYPKENRKSIGQLEDLKIKTPQGDYPLTELVDYHIERGPVNISRYNGSREVRIDAELLNPYDAVPPILEKIENTIVPEMQRLYPGVAVEYQGQARDSQETTSQMQQYFLVAFLIMVFVVMIHFKSASQGLMIILMMPLGWMGAIWGHWLHGLPVSILSAWGMVALSGVIINDAVVFLAKYNMLLEEGKKTRIAVFESGLARFRPIVLTTLTTTIGLYPIILEKSFQAQFLVPMAAALAYGVLFGTAFILVFFPVMILFVNDLRLLGAFVKNLLVALWQGKQVKWNQLIPADESMEPAVKYLKRKSME